MKFPRLHSFQIGFISIWDMLVCPLSFDEKRNAFDTFPDQNAKMAPEVSINDRFHELLCLTFLEAAKRCVAKGFPMFCKLANRLQLLMRNVMLFSYFFRPRCGNCSKSINERQVFIRYFASLCWKSRNVV